jgi:hypothetical protein
VFGVVKSCHDNELNIFFMGIFLNFHCMFAWLCSGSYTRVSLTMAFTFLGAWHCLDGLFFCPKTPPSLMPEGKDVEAWLQWNMMLARISNTTSPRTMDFGIELSSFTLWYCVKIELKRIVQFSRYPLTGFRPISYYETLGRLGAAADDAIKKASKGEDYAWLRADYPDFYNPEFYIPGPGYSGLYAGQRV